MGLDPAHTGLLVDAVGPQLAIAGTIDPVPIRQVAAKIGMHESTITRVCSACRVQNLHGVWSLTATKRGIALSSPR